ncbi:MAG: ABC transporter permease, partial [Gammaproteobacteria bacterium]
IFTDIHVEYPLITFAVIILTAMVFSLAGLLNALFAKNFDDITIIPTFVLTPLTYLGGVFFSISLLSDFWQAVALANPILYMVNAFRYGMLGSSDVSITVAFAIIIIALVAMSTIVITMLHKGIGTRV